MTTHVIPDVTAKILATLEGLDCGRIKHAGGDNRLMRCPFHEDNDPSFCMNVTNGLFICYGCGVEGNFRQFLQMLGMSSDEIQQKYGVTLKGLRENAPPPLDKGRPTVVMPENRRIEEDLLGLFHYCPEKLLADGFSEETLLHFGIGVDKQHARITFPLRDLDGHLVGVSGKAMELGQEPRYKVYKEEYTLWGLPPYHTDKSFLLWNAHTLHKRLMHENGRPAVVVVEGFKAAMWVYQAGFTNVVALMTKSMSPTQQFILERWGAVYYLMLDNDHAGVAGTIKISHKLLRTSPFKIVEYEAAQPTGVPLSDLPQLIQSAASYSDLVLS